MNRIFSNDYIRALLSTAPLPIPDAAGAPAGSALPDGEICIAPAQAQMDLAGFSPDSQKFFNAWKSWRSGGVLPRRAEVRLTTIARLMPQLAVLEVHGPDRAVFRLAGTDLEQAFGARLTGRSFIKMADEAEQQRRGELLWRVVSQPCASIMQQVIAFRSGRQDIFEIVAAPVLPDSEAAPAQVFAVISRLSRPAVTPPERNDAVVRNFGRNLRFLDIGAGIPAKS